MARKNTPAETTELSPEALAAREAVASRPRQSVKRYVELYAIVRDTAPERVEEFFGKDTAALEEASAKIENPIQKAIEKVTTTQLETAVRNLENTDELNGYANYSFDAALFEEKTRPKVARTKKSAVDKVQDIMAGASEEDLAALQALLEARATA